MEISRHWRLKAQRYRLEGSVCPTCGELSFPPRPVCPYHADQPAQINSFVLPILSKSAIKVEADLLKER